ncbi:MAG: hypothetical protein ABW133_13900 [Polyangiaceae bacterium]
MQGRDVKTRPDEGSRAESTSSSIAERCNEQRTRGWRRIARLRFVALAIVASCGNGSDHNDGAGGSINAGGAGGSSGGADPSDAGATDDAAEEPSVETPEGACLYYAQRYCRTDERCASDFTFHWNDNANCVARVKVACLARLIAPGVKDSPARVVACGDARENADCDSYLDPDRAPDVCFPPPGDLPDGAQCIVPGQCVGGGCIIELRASCGLCTKIARQGEACGLDSDCLNAMPCVNNVCTPHPRLGEACDQFSRTCAPGLACRNVDSADVGECTLPVPAGEPCDPESTGGNECDTLRLYYCDQTTNTCQRAQESPRIGEKCVATTLFCNNASYCSAERVCERRPVEGEPCELRNKECMAPARCIEGVCRGLDAAACK